MIWILTQTCIILLMFNLLPINNKIGKIKWHFDYRYCIKTNPPYFVGGLAYSGLLLYVYSCLLSASMEVFYSIFSGAALTSLLTSWSRSMPDTLFNISGATAIREVT